MSREMTNSEAISNLNHIYGIVSPDIQRSLDVAFKAMKRPPTVEPTYISDMPDDKVKDLQELAIDYGEGIAVFERKRPQGEQIAWEQGYEFGKNEKRPQGEWIPVSERLPEQNGFYITTCRDICENRVHVVMFDGVRKKWGRGGVIAWQPLPEPYMKGGAE